MEIWTQLQENDERKIPWLYKIVCFQIGIKDFCPEITSFSKYMLLQRESFLTMFYMINSSPLLVTK